MLDDQTPVEGKGDEMIPNRGLPFDEVGDGYISNQEENQNEFEDFSETDTPEDELEPMPAETDAEIEEELATGVEETTSDSVHLLDIEEVRGREAELSEDSHTSPPDFDGEVPMSTSMSTPMSTPMSTSDGDFTASRQPVQLARSDREAIMLESGAGLLNEDDLTSDEEEIAPEEAPPSPPSEGSSLVGVVKPGAEPEPETIPDVPVTEIQISPKGDARGITMVSKLPGPGPEDEKSKEPDIKAELLPSQRLLDFLVTDKEVKELWKRAEKLQEDVIEDMDDVVIARKLLNYVRDAKNKIMADKANYEEADRALNEVAYQVSHGVRSKTWTRWGYILLIYETVWGIVFTIALYLLLSRGESSLNLGFGTLISREDVFVALIGILSGGFGGVAGSLYALLRYFNQRTFNPQYNIWYYAQPVMGLLIGLFIFLFVKIGFSVTAGDPGVEIGSPLLVALLGFVAGFQQNVLYDIVRQVLKLFKIGDNEKESPEAEDSFTQVTTIKG